MLKPQTFDAITLRHYAAELNTLLLGAKVSKIQHPHKDEFLITFWGGEANNNLRGHNNIFYINLQPDYSVVFMMPPADKDRLIITTLHQPTAFCMLLRKQLNNAKLREVSTLPDERVLNLTFENFNELGNKVELVLSLELMGKHSNMILYDLAQGTVIGVAHSVSERMSQHRELTAGLDYMPPPPAAGKRSWLTYSDAMIADLLKSERPAQWPEILNRDIAGLGKRVIEQAMTLRGDDAIKLSKTLDGLYRGNNLTPVADAKNYTLLPMPGFEPKPSIQAMLYDHYTTALAENRCAGIKTKLLNQIQQAGKKLAKRQAELTPISEEEIARLQGDGNLILAAASMGELPEKPQSAQITLNNWETSQPVTLEIDPHLDWPENAALYFRRAKKAKSRQATLAEFQAKFADEQASLDQLAVLIDQADSLVDLQLLTEEMPGAAPQKKTGDKSPKHTGILKVPFSDQIEIWIGRSGEANGLLCGKLAKPEDWWLHVHQMPGSHVLIKSNTPLPTLPDDLLLKSAELAAYYSKARHSKNVPVIYTQAKHVRKIPASYPGHVTYTHEKTIYITPT